jgi:hypothetical protein
MIGRTARGFLLIGLVIVAGAAPAAAFDATSLQGWYGFGVAGFERVGPDPGRAIVGTGVMRFNGAGVVTGRASFRGLLSGDCTGDIRNSTYVVAADGTGFIFGGFFPDAACGQSPTALHFSIALHNDGNAFEMASSANDLFWGSAHRRGGGPFTPADLLGSYGFRLVALDPGFEAVATGVLTFDGVAAVTGRMTIRRAGQGTCSGTIQNTNYVVAANGTGNVYAGFFPDPPCIFSEAIPLAIAIFRGGRGFHLSSVIQERFSGTAIRTEPPEP